ncbi:hypothetical protein [Pendulispora albinea]|uniref:Uncharacterized protein n=1 Tax=Pendulispora albinea TaxID=2741071 RepID=A0ABZ2MCY1_9BACT
MTLPGARSIVSLTAAICTVLASPGIPHARAAEPDARACVAAVERGQLLHRDGKLRKARDEFIACARDSCPAPVRRDCAHWLTEVDASLPSVVFAPKLRDGRELHQGRIAFDGELLQGSLNGRAVPLDPGAHTLRFELDGAKPLTLETVIHEGEKNRLIAPTLEPLEPPPSRAQPSPPPRTAAPPEEPRAPLREPPSRPIPAAAYITGSAALIGLAGFTYFGLKGRGDLDDLRSTCGHRCARDDVDDARRKLLVGDISLAAGVVAAGITTWLVLTRPTVHTTGTSAGLTFDVRAEPHGAAASLRARF